MADVLRLPPHFQDGMILQQQVSFHLYGWCAAHAAVQVVLERHPYDGRPVSPLDKHYGVLFKKTVIADDHGEFSLDFPASEASFDPHMLTLSCGTKTICLQDILFGEVWIVAGQANMQMPISAILPQQKWEKLACVHYIRILNPPEDWSHQDQLQRPEALEDAGCQTKWLHGDQPQHIADISAVGFAFARQLHHDLNIPVGLVQTALSGSCISAWISKSALLGKHIMSRECLAETRDWVHEDGQSFQELPAHQQPSTLYERKIEPLKYMGARGVLWYQEGHDGLAPEYYAEAFQLLVTDWQRVFRSGGSKGLAFLIVQPAPFYYGQDRFTRQAEFNEMLAAVRHKLTCPAALLPLYDLPLDYTETSGDWSHPQYPVSKLPVGERLERIALGLLYDRKAPRTAPECNNIEIVGNKMILSFSQIGDGLRLSGPGERLRGFAICGPDRVYRAASARILYGVRVMVWHDEIKDPVAVSYAFADMNQEANLVSRDSLPVVPFRSDREPSDYCAPMEWTHCDSLKLWCIPDARVIRRAGWHPRWRLSRGSGEMSVEPANKVDGDGSLFISYRPDEHQEIAVEPLLGYASLFPPLHLGYYDAVTLSLFNPDQHIKHVRLALAAGLADEPLRMLRQRSPVLATLHWQTFTFSLDEVHDLLDQVHRLVLIIEDRKRQGKIYLDQIKLVRTSQSGASYGLH